ncbi:chorismate mutase [Fusibacter bizertensis]
MKEINSEDNIEICNEISNPNKGISNLRDQLDVLDYQIVELLCNRFDVTNQIGQLKRDLKMDVLDQKRELEVLSRIETIVKSIDKNKSYENLMDSISQIYKSIMLESRIQQNKL